MRKRTITILIFCTLLILNSCTTYEEITMRDAVIFSHNMEFHNSLGVRKLYFERPEDRGYTQIIFVYSEEDFLAGDFPNEAIVAWPSLVTYLSIYAANNWLRENEGGVALETYGLTYPLTVRDMIDNWEAYRSFTHWRDLDILEHSMDEFGRIMSLEENIFVGAIIVSDIDVTDFGLESPTPIRDFFRRNEITGRSIIFEMYDKLDEDVQRKLLTETPNLMADYRAELRYIEWRARHE